MESDQTTERHGLHSSRLVRFTPEIRTSVDRVEDATYAQIQDTIDRITKKGNIRFASVGRSSVVLHWREGRKFGTIVYNLKPQTGENRK